MNLKSIGFIGGGRIARIFLQAFSNNDACFSSIVVSDTNMEVLVELKARFPKINFIDTPFLPAKQDIVFIALHPAVIMEVLEQIRHEVSEHTIIVSLAPKISIERIAGKLKRVKNIVRMIPNATSVINEGYNPVCFAKETHDLDKPSLLEIFRILGHTFEVPENKLESYAIMSAMLPTYFWFQWKELIDLGCKIGLTGEESYNSVRDTMLAALRTYFYSGLTPDEVIDLVPLKPIGESEAQIRAIFNDRLIPLFERINPDHD